MYVKNNFDIECYYVGTTVRELCEARDNGCQGWQKPTFICKVQATGFYWL